MKLLPEKTQKQSEAITLQGPSSSHPWCDFQSSAACALVPPTSFQNFCFSGEVHFPPQKAGPEDSVTHTPQTPRTPRPAGAALRRRWGGVPLPPRDQVSDSAGTRPRAARAALEGTRAPQPETWPSAVCRGGGDRCTDDEGRDLECSHFLRAPDTGPRGMVGIAKGLSWPRGAPGRMSWLTQLRPAWAMRPAPARPRPSPTAPTPAAEHLQRWKGGWGLLPTPSPWDVAGNLALGLPWEGKAPVLS